MKPERTTLSIAQTTPGLTWSKQALRVGDWYVHRSERGGLTVAHRSSLAVAFGVSPVSAVRLLRALQQAPPCPVTDEQLQTWAYDGEGPATIEEPVFAWLATLKELIANR